MKVLIGYGGSLEAETILEDVSRAGLPPDVEILLVAATDMEPLPAEATPVPEVSDGVPAAWESDISEGDQAFLTAMMENARRSADARRSDVEKHTSPVADRLRQMFPGGKVHHKIVMESPFYAIMDQATRWHADLVIVGAHGGSAVRKLFLGSISQSVVSHVHCPVRIARVHHPRREGPVRLVVGFDGSADSERALDAVCKRAWPAGTQARVVVAEEAKSAGFFAAHFHRLPKPAHPDWTVEAWLMSIADGLCERLRGCGLEAEPHVVTGDAKHVLLDEAEKWGADCIFVGAKGQRADEVRPLGAVTSVISARAHCSVEIMKPNNLS